MNEPNNLIASCYNDAVYSTSWPKTQPISVTEQLEKWNKVRQSLYSQNGWCSENVNQISKWDVGELDRNGSVPPQNTHKDSYETGTNNWNVNLSHHHGSEPYPPMQDGPFCIGPNTTVGATGAPAAAAMSANTPALQMTQWGNSGAIPKIYNHQHHHYHPTNLNCLSVTTAPSNFEFPTTTATAPGPCSSQQHQQFVSPENPNATVFYDCDNINMMKSPPTARANNCMDDDVNLALRLQFDTMNLEQNFCNPDATAAQMNNAPNLNPISRSICQMSNQYHQVDCLPKAFS